MELLKNKHYDRVQAALKQVKINHLFARSVAEGNVQGKVFVDCTQCPKTIYVVHPYGMSLLFGNPNNPEFNHNFLNHSLNKNKMRDGHEWMQAPPGDWQMVLSKLFGNNMIVLSEKPENEESENIGLTTRLNFGFNKQQYSNAARLILPENCTIKRTGKSIFQQMPGSVIPSFFWDTADNFLKNGIGFSLFCEGKLAATAFSAFIHDKMLEIGIETIPEFRGSGFAQLVCFALIDYCIENDYEPIWACKVENTGSVKLARKIGFEIEKEIPYYRLSK